VILLQGFGGKPHSAMLALLTRFELLPLVLEQKELFLERKRNSKVDSFRLELIETHQPGRTSLCEL